MHTVTIDMDIITPWISTLTGAFAIVTYIYGHWSRKQDKKLGEMNAKINILLDTARDLRKYIRQLLFILKKHNIDYPTPPDSFYDDTIDPSVIKKYMRERERNNEQD